MPSKCDSTWHAKRQCKNLENRMARERMEHATTLIEFGNETSEDLRLRTDACNSATRPQHVLRSSSWSRVTST